MKIPVTYLFVPGNRPDRFDKALATGADAIILDLEDAIAPGDKDAARDSVRRWLATNPAHLGKTVVRINDAATPWFDADLALIRESGIRLAMLPKAETAEQIAAVGTALAAEGGVLPLVETARGVLNVEVLAQAQGVQRLAFGTLDYGVDVDLSGDERGLHYPAARIALASRVAGLYAPVAGVTAAIGDDEPLRADLAFARAFGFGAKLCIHPRQVGIVRDAFVPAPAEVDWARRVVAAAAGGSGAVQVDGRMVDRPVLRKAQAILDRAVE